MSLIPEAFLQTLRARIDIVELINACVPLKKAGQNHVACCPFHAEKSPSFTVNRRKQFYHCFGCQAHGDAIRFVQEFEGLGFVDAVEKLAAQAGLPVPKEATGASPRPTYVDEYALMEKASAYFQAQLKSKTPEAKRARDYLENRGFNAQALAQFQVGFAPESWDALQKHLQVSPEKLEKVGLVIRQEGKRPYDRFRGRIMFPIRDKRGRTIGFGGRVIAEGQPKYLNSPETILFQKRDCLYGVFEAAQQKRRWNKAVLVEGYLDVMALSQAGILGAFATLGTAVSTQHLQLLFRESPQVIVCFDGDTAGRKAAWNACLAALPLMEGSRQLSFLFLEEGADPDSYIRQFGVGAFKRLALEAYPLSTFLFDSLQQQISLDSIDSCARFVNEARPLLTQLPEGVFRDMMFDRLGQLTGPKAAQRSSGQKRLSVWPPAQVATALLRENPSLASELGEIQWLSSVQGTGISTLARLIAFIRENPEADKSEIDATLGKAVTYAKKAGPIANLPVTAWRAEFLGAIERIAVLGKEQLTDRLLKKARSAEGLSEAEKKHLKQLLGAIEQKPFVDDVS